MKVIGYKFDGNSFPIIVQDNTQNHFVKLRGGMSGEYSILCEWFGNSIGKALGINTRLPQWFKISNELEYQDIHIEVRELIDKSHGLNISFDYIDDVIDFSLDKNINKSKFIDVFLLDVLMLNIDRTATNPNLIVNTKGDFIVSDFESSLFFNELLNSNSLLNDKRILQCLKVNPFFQKIEVNKLNDFIKKLNTIDFDSLFDSLPDEIIQKGDKKRIIEQIREKINLDWELKRLLENIENTQLETTDERESRTKRNREKFERLTGSRK